MTRYIEYAEVFLARNGSWCVRYTSEPSKSQITRLFGTNELPTPFTSLRSFDDVVSHLRMMPSNASTCFVESRPEVAA